MDRTPGTRRDKAKSSLIAAAGLALTVVAVLIQPLASSPTSHGFDEAFYDFLYDHDYTGGAVAAMKDGRLLFAKGYGVDRAGNDVTAHSKFHTSSLAKSMTAIAIMRLVQEGRLALDDKVFGNGGVLAHIQPWRRETVDPRLQLITVDQLLRHSCGWDADQGPLYDPLLNKLYLDRGHDVPDIARQMDIPAPLEPEDLIRYIISQPLDFTPGTRTAYSNMAYLVLGRVVETAAQIKYKEFIKKYILQPCGMWNTRLDLAPGHEDFQAVFGDGSQDSAQNEVVDGSDSPMYRTINAAHVDSALGWFSTVYDLMRFSRCTFETGQILNDRHLELLLARSPTTQDQDLDRGDTWYAAGFRTNSRGLVWQDGDQHADDLILYHDLRPPPELSTPAPETRPAEVVRSRRAWAHNSWDWQADDPAAAAREQEEELRTDMVAERERLPESWVVLLHGKSVRHLRHYSRDLMTRLDLSRASLPQENLFLYDLSDLHRHPSWRSSSYGRGRGRRGSGIGGRLTPPEMTVRYRVDEHHLTAYVDALQDEGFDVHWFTSFTQEAHTSFLVVGRRVLRPVRSQYDFVFQHGLDHRRLLKNKLWLERSGYNLTQLHSYNSFSHASASETFNKRSRRGRGKKSGVPRFAAVFRFEAFPHGTQMKYGTGHLPEPYHKLVEMYHEKEFYPLSQTVTWTQNAKKDKEEVAFVFIKRADPREPRTEFWQQYDLSVTDLAKVTAKNTKAERRLSYLNSYKVPGNKFRFSAVYTNNTYAQGLLETNQSQNKASEITISNLKMGLAPKFMVPYMSSGELRYVIYYEEY